MNRLAADEGMKLAQVLGLDLATVSKAVHGGEAQSHVVDRYLEKYRDMPTAGLHRIALDKDAKFLALRTDLEKAMVKAIRSNNSAFDDPWGLVALYMAADGAATASATLVSPKLTLFLPE